MDKLHLKPYSYRGRLMSALYFCAIFSCLVSLIMAYFVSQGDVTSEIELRQRDIAVYLLEMQEKTDLPMDELIKVAQQDDLTISEVIRQNELPAAIRKFLNTHAIYSSENERTGMPVTFVQLASDFIVRIDAAPDIDLFFTALFRILFTSLAYLFVFVLMITLAAYFLSRPVRLLTNATTQIREGDFSVRLPDDEAGEMGELMRSFNDMTEALGSTAYLQKDFISSISHEFKTPIASIRGFARLLQMPGLSEAERNEYVMMIAKESDRLSRLSETLLRLSALEQQTALASLSSFQLDEQLRQAILRLEPAWGAKRIDWQLDMEALSIVSDEALLVQVWTNLLQNAIKFSPDESLIEVNVYSRDHAIVEIRDHGCGMDEATIDRIFDKFYQSDKSRRQEGVGLGLSLVKRILDMLGGQVQVSSVPGEGSTFTVILPLKPPHSKRALPEVTSHGQSA